MDPVSHPIHLADAHSGIAPHAYILFKRSQRCSHCGTRHEWSELFAKTNLASRASASKYITNLRPLVDAPKYNLPISVETSPTRTVAFCHECADRISLTSLPYPPDNIRIVAGYQNANLFDKPKPDSKSPTPPRSTAEILDLI